MNFECLQEEIAKDCEKVFIIKSTFNHPYAKQNIPYSKSNSFIKHPGLNEDVYYSESRIIICYRRPVILFYTQESKQYAHVTYIILCTIKSDVGLLLYTPKATEQNIIIAFNVFLLNSIETPNHNEITKTNK